MKTLFRFPRLILAAMAAMAGISQAGVLFQDGFNYPQGALDGSQNGGTGFATGSSWGDSDGADAITGGLNFWVSQPRATARSCRMDTALTTARSRYPTAEARST